LILVIKASIYVLVTLNSSCFSLSETCTTWGLFRNSGMCGPIVTLVLLWLVTC